MFELRQDKRNEWLDRPFARLVRHAAYRVFAGGESAEPGELDLGIGTILAILAAPGAFVSIIVSDRYGSLLRWLHGQAVAFDPYAASASDEYFFIVLAMVMAAAVAVWKWDRLLPDRRDFQNLAPLPVASRTIFLANIFAIVSLAVVLSIDVNAISCVLFPLFVTFQSRFGIFLKFLATHALAALLAGAFGFLAVLAILGAMMSVLPFGAFRKLSFYVRCGLLFYLVVLLATGFSVPERFPQLAGVPQPWTRVPPPAWFLGLCEWMRGTGRPLFVSFGAAAVVALLLAIALSLAAFSFSFRRSYLRSAESTESRLPGSSRASFMFRALDKVLLRSAFDRGCYRFVLRTIFRSQEHAFVFGVFGTVGVVLSSQTLLAARAPESASIPSARILSIPLILGFFLVLGLYAAFSVPAPLRSNWVFRFHVDPRTRKSPALARKVVFTFLVPLLFAPCLALYSYFWGWRVGLLHTAIVVVWCTLLLEGLLVKYRKIPFTCSIPGFQSHAIVTALLFLLGFFAFTSFTATVENWALPEPAWFLVFLPVVAGFSLLFYRRRKGLIESDRLLAFEEKSPATVEAMNLVR
jgi:hypothetical protein